MRLNDKAVSILRGAFPYSSIAQAVELLKARGIRLYAGVYDDAESALTAIAKELGQATWSKDQLERGAMDRVARRLGKKSWRSFPRITSEELAEVATLDETERAVIERELGYRIRYQQHEDEQQRERERFISRMDDVRCRLDKLAVKEPMDDEGEALRWISLLKLNERLEQLRTEGRIYLHEFAEDTWSLGDEIDAQLQSVGWGKVAQFVASRVKCMAESNSFEFEILSLAPEAGTCKLIFDYSDCLADFKLFRSLASKDSYLQRLNFTHMRRRKPK